ncbi:MAG: hypothetical protein FD125_2074 [bacterium]|nr:MAG: hypothetical protein FD125_2074 [bacterium]
MSRLAVAFAALALTAVSGAAQAQTQTPPPANPATAAPAAARPTIASSIKDLLANAQTRAVVEKHLPGVSQHPALPQFQDMTLAQVAPVSGGAVTPAIIAAIDADLKALPAG